MSDEISRIGTHADVVRILEDALADAKAGKILEVVVMSYTTDPDEPWDYHIGPTRRMMGWIGHLEVTKQDWIADLKGRTE